VEWWNSGQVGWNWESRRSDRREIPRFADPLGITGFLGRAERLGWLLAVPEGLTRERVSYRMLGDALGHRLKPTRGAYLRPPQKPAATQAKQKRNAG
jgi:hypothetical protein